MTPNGVPSSSFRAYRLPIEAFESSTREAIPRLRNFCETCETSGLNSALDERGTMRHLIGATVGGRDRTARLTSSARAQYECSRSE